MSQTVTKALLSGSTNGKGIKITGTNSGSATTIHTAVSGTSSSDEIWLWCYNSDSSTRTLTILWGGTTSPDDEIKIDIPSLSGRFLVVDGRLLQNGLVVKAFASAANVLIIDGFVNAIV